ncbi:MAG: hypothetical protein AAGH89_02360 [Verrucomicrobiota bacterium]
MKTNVFVIGGLLLQLAGSLSAEPREFTSTDGAKILAEVEFVSDGKVSLQRNDGRSFTVPVTRFSPEDQLYIQKWKEENKGKVPPHLKDKKPRINMRVSTGARSSKDDDKESGFVNEQKKKVALKAVVVNEDAVYPIDTVNVAFMIWGRSPETRKNVVVHRQDFQNEKLPLNITREFQGESLEIWFDDIGAMYGHQYKGYFIYIADQSGKILAEKTIPSSANKYMDAIKELKAGDAFDSKYVKTGKESVSKTVRKG